jgi:RimJ/RimL family protein N-acetyltransferase
MALAALAGEGIHDPDTMPFYEPWTRKSTPELERGVLQFAWSRRATLSREDWGLPLAVIEAGEPLGIQDLFAKSFGVTRSVETGSWLVQRAQGRGIGKEMRSAVLHLAFEGLGAVEAGSASFEDNLRSEGVTRAMGYAPNGVTLFPREGAPVRTNRWVLTRERWLDHRRNDITLAGVDACRPLLDSAY